MKMLAPKSLITWVLLIAIGWACGPFFPDTVLNKPQAALDVPPVSYLEGLYQLSGKALPREDPKQQWNDDSGFLSQIPLELAELEGVWKSQGLTADEILARKSHYEDVRTKLLAPVTEADLMGFSFQEGVVWELPERPLGNDFPPEVADYVEGARLLAKGEIEKARDIWKAILGRPLEEKKLRSLWAAWMLAKTSKDMEECFAWYERVETEAEAGGTDALGLRWAAKAWRASRLEDPIDRVHFYHQAFQGGKTASALDLRRSTGAILASEDGEMLARAAADPIVRRLVNLDLYASLDGPKYRDTWEQEAGVEEWPWLTALKAVDLKNMEEAAHIGWALYSSGRYDDAEKWLGLADPKEPLALWLSAKFDLRKGDVDAASRHLSEAVKIESSKEGWEPENPSSDGGRWYFDANEIAHAHQSRLLADAGIVSLAREEYLSALELLREGGFWEDAAYVAERLISTDSLVKYVRSIDPEWTPAAEDSEGEQKVIDPYTCLTSRVNLDKWSMGKGNQLRYLLARRLAREYRFAEAREFMPPQLVPVLDHYVALHRARLSGKYSGEALAAITWRQALIHRHLGAELFSTEGAPDGGALGWSFPPTRFDTARFPEIDPSGEPEQVAVPPVSRDELERIRKSRMPHEERFQYRYRATDIAWEAGKALPANHPLLARLYNTAGQWIASEDPKAADRFYQALVRRCARTKEGKSADDKRWFLRDLGTLGDMPALPARFKKAEAD
jgi:tetratricopeptide (TPR) repeat protein